MTDRRCLFLDIDGVLNSGIRHETVPTWYSDPLPDDLLLVGKADWVEKPKLKLLRDFVLQHDIIVVGISSWFSSRYSNIHGYGGKSHKDVSKAFEFEIYDVSYITSGSNRDKGAEHWLQDHADLNIKYYAFLDDGDHYANKNNPLIVAPCGRYGLDESHIQQLKNILKIDEK